MHLQLCFLAPLTAAVVCGMLKVINWKNRRKVFDG